MTDLWEHATTALVTAVGISALGWLVSRLRSRRRRRLEGRGVGGALRTPPDEFGAWTFAAGAEVRIIGSAGRL